MIIIGPPLLLLGAIGNCFKGHEKSHKNAAPAEAGFGAPLPEIASRNSDTADAHDARRAPAQKHPFSGRQKAQKQRYGRRFLPWNAFEGALASPPRSGPVRNDALRGRGRLPCMPAPLLKEGLQPLNRQSSNLPSWAKPCSWNSLHGREGGRRRGQKGEAAAEGGRSRSKGGGVRQGGGISGERRPFKHPMSSNLAAAHLHSRVEFHTWAAAVPAHGLNKQIMHITDKSYPTS